MTKADLNCHWGASKLFEPGDLCFRNKPAESIEIVTVRDFQAQPIETKAFPNAEAGKDKKSKSIGITGLDIPETWIERADIKVFIARSEAKALCTPRA